MWLVVNARTRLYVDVDIHMALVAAGEGSVGLYMYDIISSRQNEKHGNKNPSLWRDGRVQVYLVV